MDINHYNELIDVSQDIYNQATEKLTNYLTSKYCAIGNDTAEQQLEDYLFITEETSAFFLGNSLALLDEKSQEDEIRRFTEKVCNVIRYAQQQAGGHDKPN